jgi:hypothetical protein
MCLVAKNGLGGKKSIKTLLNIFSSLRSLDSHS